MTFVVCYAVYWMMVMMMTDDDVVLSSNQHLALRILPTNLIVAFDIVIGSHHLRYRFQTLRIHLLVMCCLACVAAEVDASSSPHPVRRIRIASQTVAACILIGSLDLSCR